MWDRNPRHNDGAPVEQVAESIQRFGFGAPILARRENGEIIAGHTRYKAAKQLGLDRVPVRFLDLDPVDAHLLAVADNKTAELADWDDELLAGIFREFSDQKVDVLTGTGFDQKEIEKIIGTIQEEGSVDQSTALRDQFVVLVECTDEDHQTRTIEQLQTLGMTCRALI